MVALRWVWQTVSLRACNCKTALMSAWGLRLCAKGVWKNSSIKCDCECLSSTDSYGVNFKMLTNLAGCMICMIGMCHCACLRHFFFMFASLLTFLLNMSIHAVNLQVNGTCAANRACGWRKYFVGVQQKHKKASGNESQVLKFRLYTAVYDCQIWLREMKREIYISFLISLCSFVELQTFILHL